MAVNSETEINLRTLQRVDSNIVEIIDNASQAAIYKYERKLDKWEVTDVEGALFLYRRSLYPFHGFIIVNRMSTTNFVEVITSDMEFVLQEPYFLYKKSCGEIIGSWFYEKKDFRRITNKIQSIVLKQTAPPRRQRCSSDGESQLKKDDGVQDIMSMLSEAHTEYIKNEEADEKISEKNTEEDFNNLTTYIDKKLNNKSVNPSEEKPKKSPWSRCSSEEKYLSSPRRRFLSTGSYDPSRVLQFNSNKIINQLVYHSKDAAHNSDAENIQKRAESKPVDRVRLSPLQSDNAEDLLTPTKFLPHFNFDEILTPSLSGVSILDQSVEPIQVPLKPHISNASIPITVQKTTSGDYKPKWTSTLNNRKDYNLHSSDLKGTLISHLEWDTNIMLKIHEAYVASLKSLLTQKKT